MEQNHRTKVPGNESSMELLGTKVPDTNCYHGQQPFLATDDSQLINADKRHWWSLDVWHE